jgi:hypothetical protein
VLQITVLVVAIASLCELALRFANFESENSKSYLDGIS